MCCIFEVQDNIMTVVGTKVLLLIGKRQSLAANHDAISIFQPLFWATNICHDAIVPCCCRHIRDVSSRKHHIALENAMCIFHLEQVSKRIVDPFFFAPLSAFF